MSNRYKNTPTTSFYLDVWNPVNIPRSIEDREIVIDPKYDRRPDLLSYDLYSDHTLWWVFSMYNKDILIDPIEDFSAGKVITVPSNRSIERLR